MNTAEEFGFSSSLQRDYQTIGRELLNYEASSLGPQLAFRDFREGVVFVPIAVLESYLEDLLDSSIFEEHLHISGVKPKLWLRNSLAVISAIFGLCILAGLLLHVLPLASGFALAGVCGLILYYLCFLSPKGKLIRRMGFAKVVSKEISRRRGIDDQGRRPAKQILEDWFTKASGAGPLVGAAKVTIH